MKKQCILESKDMVYSTWKIMRQANTHNTTKLLEKMARKTIQKKGVTALNTKKMQSK